jgi:twitching motility protein PilT
MDSPINRFRRDDLGGEVSGEGVTEMDFRLVSIEDELKTVSLSSAMQARDFQALRAKVESLENKTGGDINETLSRVFDHVEAQDERIELVLERLQVLDGHLTDLAARLDDLGDIGPIENLPSLLEQSLVTSLDDLEARLELKIESSAREHAGAGSAVPAEQFELLKEELESRSRSLSESVDKLLENRQEEILEMLQETTASLDIDQLKTDMTKDLDQIRDAVVELQEAYEAVPTRDDLERVEAKAVSAGGSVSSSDDLTALAGEVATFKEQFAELQERVSSLGDMGGDSDWQEKLDEIVRLSELAESHQEKVDEAMRLVSELEEKTKSLGTPVAAPAPIPDDGLAPPPGDNQLKLTLRDLVREMVKNRVSDLHIKTGRAITARIGKELIQFSTPPLSPADAYYLIASALKSSHRKRLVEERDIEFVYQYESIRLRANVFFDRGNLSATFKMLSNRPPELENLGLPKAFSTLLGRPSGLVLVCGLPGSGRSTTLTASLDYLNRTKQLHLVSLEDRLDFTHEDRRSLVTQREMGADIVSFSQGVRRAMGQDSDVVFVSNLADKATMEAVFAAVDSGLLVVGSITAQNAEDAIPRLINLFPETERKMRARLFSRSLQGILSLKLFERADGDGQIPASELLLANSTVKRLIEDANLSALHRQVVGGSAEGMQTFSDSIERLVETGLIKAEAGKAELDRLSGSSRRSSAASSSSSSSAPSLKPSVPRQEKRLDPPVPAPLMEPPPSASPPAYSSNETKSAPQAPPPPDDNEAFGEEDTLMNWL